MEQKEKNRTIKFRAWSKEAGLTMPNNEWGLSSKGYPVYFGEGGEMGMDKGTILMEFTGLKDKNGKEIYEGDVIKLCQKYWETEIGIIGCQFGSFGIENVAQVEFAELETYSWIGNGTGERTNILDEIEIIGNIYENQKLIKKLTNNFEEKLF